MLKGFVFLLLDFASIYTKSMPNASIFFRYKMRRYVPYQRILHKFFMMQNASTLPTHFVTKNQNVSIVTLVQNALHRTYLKTPRLPPMRHHGYKIARCARDTY